MITALVVDIIYLMETVAENTGESIDILKDIVEESNFFNVEDSWINLREMYAESKKVILKKRTVQIYMEVVSIEQMLFDYVFDGCLKLLFNILEIETVFCKQNADKKAKEFKTIIDFVLALISKLIEFEHAVPQFPFTELEAYLSKISLIKAYKEKKKTVIDIANKLHSKLQKRKDENKYYNDPKKGQTQSELRPLDIYN